MYNLDKVIANYKETVGNTKTENSRLKVWNNKLEGDRKQLDNKLKNFHMKKVAVSSQTSNTIDTPYTVTDDLPPIFGSKCCIISKRPFISNSLPNLSTVLMVNVSEDDMIRDAAEEALSLQYDREIEKFYDDARARASGLRQVFEENVIGLLFDPNGWMNPLPFYEEFIDKVEYTINLLEIYCTN